MFAKKERVKKLRKFEHMSKLGLPYLPRSLVWTKNAAKRSRQHAGKKYREYAQRRVCFVNEQVP